jgi:hypothetical protein
MLEIQLPTSVQKILGKDTARDLAEWLDAHYGSRSSQTLPTITSFVARQKVNALVQERVSNIMLSGEPELFQLENGPQVWRVPVFLTFTSHGIVGQVGSIDVDTGLGEIRFTDDDLDRIAAEADRMAGETFPGESA